MTRTIEIIVTPDGQSRVETKGFTGGECREASKFIEQALGTTVTEVTTPNFYQSEVRRTENQQRT